MDVGVDYQVLFNIVATLAGFLGGWVLNGIREDMRRLDTDVRAMPTTYVTKTDYRSDLGDIKALLVRIESKLDGKADK
jgi:hypothetical protein